MTRTVIIGVLLLALSFAGCETTPPTEEEIALNRKQQLCKQIDRQYENPEAHYQLGKIYHDEGTLDKAEYAYKTAIGFKPAHYRAQAALVKVVADQKQVDRSRVVAELYISQAAVSAPGSLRLGKAFEYEELDRYALGCYYQASGLDPEWAEPYKQIGFYYLARDDKVRAEENLRRSFELDPYQPEVSAELGRLGVPVHTPHKTTDSIPGELPM
ncbi:MAG: hypothetical protein ABFR90_07200 [Planctomycetota bacterium]